MEQEKEKRELIAQLAIQGSISPEKALEALKDLEEEETPVLPQEETVIPPDEFSEDAEGETQAIEYPSQIIPVETLEDMGLIDGGTILDPWTIIKLNEHGS